MFTSFREKLQSVQGNLTTSFRGLSTNDDILSTGKIIHTGSLNLNAGTELLEKFQNSWAEIHSLTVENAKKAEVADQTIANIHKKLDSQFKSVFQSSAVLSTVPQVILDLDLLGEKLDDLNQLVIGVEKSLINLENLIAIRNLQEKQVAHQFQLARYNEKKLSLLEETKVLLAREHAEKVARHEARQVRIKRERQETFGQQFKLDLTAYKETKNIPKIAARTETFEKTKLEEVVLDTVDSKALDEFLGDEASGIPAPESIQDNST